MALRNSWYASDRIALEIPLIPSFTSVSFAFYLHYLSRSRGRDIRRPVRENSDCLCAKLQESQSGEWSRGSKSGHEKRRGVIISSSSTMACEFFKVSRETSTINDEKKNNTKKKKISKHLSLFIVRARNRLPI